jgi:hypothetical protein
VSSVISKLVIMIGRWGSTSTIALDYQQLEGYQSVTNYHDDQNGLYLPDISKTLDGKNGTRGGSCGHGLIRWEPLGN